MKILLKDLRRLIQEVISQVEEYEVDEGHEDPDEPLSQRDREGDSDSYEDKWDT